MAMNPYFDATQQQQTIIEKPNITILDKIILSELTLSQAKLNILENMIEPLRKLGMSDKEVSAKIFKFQIESLKSFKEKISEEKFFESEKGGMEAFKHTVQYSTSFSESRLYGIFHKFDDDIKQGINKEMKKFLFRLNSCKHLENKESQKNQNFKKIKQNDNQEDFHTNRDFNGRRRGGGNWNDNSFKKRKPQFRENFQRKKNFRNRDFRENSGGNGYQGQSGYQKQYQKSDFRGRNRGNYKPRSFDEEGRKNSNFPAQQQNEGKRSFRGGRKDSSRGGKNFGRNRHFPEKKYIDEISPEFEYRVEKGQIDTAERMGISLCLKDETQGCAIYLREQKIFHFKFKNGKLRKCQPLKCSEIFENIDKEAHICDISYSKYLDAFLILTSDKNLWTLKFTIPDSISVEDEEEKKNQDNNLSILTSNIGTLDILREQSSRVMRINKKGNVVMVKMDNFNFSSYYLQDGAMVEKVSEFEIKRASGPIQDYKIFEEDNNGDMAVIACKWGSVIITELNNSIIHSYTTLQLEKTEEYSDIVQSVSICKKNKNIGVVISRSSKEGGLRSSGICWLRLSAKDGKVGIEMVKKFEIDETFKNTNLRAFDFYGFFDEDLIFFGLHFGAKRALHCYRFRVKEEEIEVFKQPWDYYHGHYGVFEFTVEGNFGFSCDKFGEVKRISIEKKSI